MMGTDVAMRTASADTINLCISEHEESYKVVLFYYKTISQIVSQHTKYKYILCDDPFRSDHHVYI
jgi:hypothetical protein